MQNKLNVYIVTYNRAKYLKECITSILNQSFKEFDLYVLDNASTDNTGQVVKEMNDSRLYYICHSKNLTGSGNINYAYKHCEKEYFIAFHDDDIMHEDMLEKEMAYIESHKDCTLVSCHADILDMNKNRVIKGAHFPDQYRIYYGEEILDAYLYKQKHLIFPSILYNNQFMKENNLQINPNVGPCADVVLYMEAARRGGKILVIQDSLMNSRLHSQQDSSKNFGSMIIKLFHYLNSINYYKDYLNHNMKGQYIYFRWFIIKVIIRAASGAISTTRGIEEIKQLSKEIHFRKMDYWLGAVSLRLESILPKAFRFMYQWYKERNA